MNRSSISTLIFAVALYCVPVFAQHGHAGGGMGMGSTHANSHADSSAMTGNSASSAHGQTMTQILSNNTKLSGKIQQLTGMPASTACANFKNLGQCVAAAHVSGHQLRLLEERHDGNSGACQLKLPRVWQDRNWNQHEGYEPRECYPEPEPNREQ